MSNCLWPHGLQDARLPCPSLMELLELAQTQVHWVGDAIQLSHPRLSLSPLAFNLSQHQGLFQWVSSSHQVAKVLELQLQHQSWILQTRILEWVAVPFSRGSSQPGIEPRPPALQVDSLPAELPGKPPNDIKQATKVTKHNGKMHYVKICQKKT